MGLPWDERNVKPNLRVIASLRKGDKLSVLKSGATPNNRQFSRLGKGGRGLRERFDRQQGGFWAGKREIERAKKGEDILDDNQYLVPLTGVFQAANLLWHEKRGIQAAEIANAYRGLEQMRLTYATSGRPERQKMREILTAISPLVPRVGASRCIRLKGNQTINLLKRNEVINLSETFVGLIENRSAGVSTEQAGTAEERRTVFATDQPSTAQATQIPMNGGTAYTRQRLGVCPSFWKDHNRTPARLHGRALTTRAAGVKTLFDELGRDEAMLFLTSQIACQGGIEGFVMALFAFRTPSAQRRRKNDWLFSYGNVKLNPVFWADHALDIKVNRGKVEIRSTMSIGLDNPAAFLCCELATDPNDDKAVIQPFSGTRLGISQFTAVAAITCWRSGNSISWKLDKAELRFRG